MNIFLPLKMAFAKEIIPETILKCKILQRAITKFNQVIYSSSPISSPSFNPLAEIAFEKPCWQVDGIYSKVDQVIYSLSLPYQLTKFQDPSSNNFRKILLTSLKCSNLQRVISFVTPEKCDGIYSKVNQVIYSSSPISWLSFKPLAQIVFHLSCWQDFILIFLKGHNFRQEHNSDK